MAACEVATTSIATSEALSQAPDHRKREPARLPPLFRRQLHPTRWQHLPPVAHPRRCFDQHHAALSAVDGHRTLAREPRHLQPADRCLILAERRTGDWLRVAERPMDSTDERLWVESCFTIFKRFLSR